MIQLQPQHISTQLNHDCHLNWSGWLNRHLSLEHLPKLLRPPVVFFRFVCFPAGVALTFVWNTKGSLDKYKLSVCILFTWRQICMKYNFCCVKKVLLRLSFFGCFINKSIYLLLVQVWWRGLRGEKRSVSDITGWSVSSSLMGRAAKPEPDLSVASSPKLTADTSVSSCW